MTELTAQLLVGRLEPQEVAVGTNGGSGLLEIVIANASSFRIRREHLRERPGECVSMSES